MARQLVTKPRTIRRLAARLGVAAESVVKVQSRGGTGHRFDVFLADDTWWYVWPDVVTQAGTIETRANGSRVRKCLGE
jgi:hypothetical protein